VVEGGHVGVAVVAFDHVTDDRDNVSCDMRLCAQVIEALRGVRIEPDGELVTTAWAA
jgi:hypothetical protein